MVRLYDRINRYGLQPHPMGGHGLLKPTLDTIRGGLPVIVTDNVALHWFTNYQDPTSTEAMVRDLPNIVPPFPDCFIEAEIPRSFRFNPPKGLDLPPEDIPENFGAVAITTDLWEGYDKVPEELRGQMAQNAINKQYRGTKSTLDAGAILSPVRWLIEFYFIFHQSDTGNSPFGPIIKMGVVLQPDGSFAKDGRGNPTYWGMHAPGSLSPTTNVGNISGSIAIWLKPLLMGLAFIHCKNVKTVQIVPDDKIARAYRKRTNGKELVRYYTLLIDPDRQTKTDIEAGRVPSDITRALHIVRGHFSTYTPERPLFGRLTGTFWIPSHTRGNIDAGLVIKDYEVKHGS